MRKEGWEEQKRRKRRGVGGEWEGVVEASAVLSQTPHLQSSIS